MRLFDFIEQHDRIGMSSHLFRKLTAFFVANVSGWRADEAGDGMLLHVFRHVNAYQRVFVVEEKFGEAARQFGFSNSGRPQKYEGADGPFGIT